ncbi:MAG TPA: archaellin/type IV pilin N-terminal domain-containing protein [Methanosarcina sp.]|nr:archaellin/type IV pilin N-terminal domain-containing protein [Methanosarcina sp.]
MWNRFLKDDKGFTGLEAAIVLIAFVVVAAVFSYVMLGAGFYTTQKSQEVVHTGVTQASSSVAPSGEVIVEGMAGSKATNITFYLTSTAGGTPVDLNKTIITYTDADEVKTFDYASTAWTYSTVISKTGGSANLLENDEKVKIVLTLTGKVTSEPTINEHIKIEVKPPEGAVLTLGRTMPPALAASTYYPVY